jgi:hypothetical protein
MALLAFIIYRLGNLAPKLMKLITCLYRRNIRADADTSSKIFLTESQLTSWNRVLLEKLTVAQIVKSVPAFYVTRKFIILFTRVCHWFVS